MHGFIRFWARNGVAANLLMILILIVGAAMFLRMEREVFPSAKFDVVNIGVSWPGASPRDVEEQIILRIEEVIADLDNMKEMSAQAREGYASLTVTMEDGGDFDSFLNEVKARIDGVSNLPPSSYPPVVSRQLGTMPMSWVAIIGDENVSEVELNRLARQYRDELAQIPNGSSLIEIQGYRSEEVSIEVTEGTLRRYGLTFDDIAASIRGASINRSSGEVRTSTGNIPLAVRQLADTEEEFERIVVRRNQDGSVLRLGDIAEIDNGFNDANFIYRINGQRGRTLEIRQPEKINIVTASQAVIDWVDRKNESDSVPQGVTLTHIYSMSDMYFGRMNLVKSNAFTGLILVLGILILFLRPVVAFWVAAGIAISFVGTFIFLPAVGVSLNMLSLFALLLVIGIVVDDALIVGESIHRQTERGREGIDAAIIGTQIVVKPVIFAVLTTMIAFSPFLFIGGGTSEFTKHIAWTIIFALTFSLIESFMILPSHLAHMKRPSPTGFAKFQSRFADALLWFADHIYRPILRTALAARYFTVTIFVMLFILSVNLLSQGWIEFKFMPDVEQRFIQLDIDMQRGTPFNRTLQVYDQINEATEQLKQELSDKNEGREIVENQQVWAWSGGLYSFLNMSESSKRSETLSTIMQRYRELIGPIPDAEEINITYSFDNSGSRFYVSLESANLDELTEAVQEIKAYLGEAGELYDVGDSFESSQEELRFSLKPGAERFGLSIGEISRQVRQAFYGEEAQRLPRDGQDVRVMIRYPLEVRESLESLSNMRIRTPDGREIALEAVAEVTYAPAVRRIDRTDRKRSATVRARIRDGADVGPLRAKFYGGAAGPGDAQKILSKYPDVTFKKRGADQEQGEFMRDVMILYGLAIFGMYMLLAIAFSSYWQPLMIMSAIPFGLMGAIFGHLMLGENFAMFSIFGICAAGGVVVNDNLVLVDYVNRLRNEGVGALSALIEAGVVRFRPILLTSVTTFVGMVPILMESSPDAQFLRPMIISLSFGVLFALFVTLLFVPALYGVGVDIARFYRGLWTGEKQPSLGHGQSEHGLGDVDLDELEFQDEKNLKPAE
ncbi:efflux RND transporter permease subunit [Parvularcula sp. LCG005]|uniref:efflux RND transporter permease subunit n=1 Tax=Parvularcula sp. LCG005 TaxID=3078805 RepID=UPI002943B31F|nr:efflux RND transporter permease subunit [Parvularcula sp. LCG005]WOI52388.1 efflux RND transporter permease subunit [Parvularcula sp. LCG005]